MAKRASRGDEHGRVLLVQGGSPERAFATACFPAEAAVKRVQAALRHGGRDTGRVMSEESTTPDQVELVRGLVDALDRCDVDTVASFHARDAVLEAAVGRFEGVAAIRGFSEDWLANYEEFAATLEEVRNLGSGVTFSVIRQQGRLVGSSGHVQLRNAMVNVWVDGVIARTITGPDIDEARAAAERLVEERA